MVWYGGGDLAGQAPPTDGGREEKVEGRRGKGSWALEGERETALSPDMVGWMVGWMDGWFESWVMCNTLCIVYCVLFGQGTPLTPDSVLTTSPDLSSPPPYLQNRSCFGLYLYRGVL